MTKGGTNSPSHVYSGYSEGFALYWYGLAAVLIMPAGTVFMMWLGEHLLAYGAIQSPAEVERHIVGVTAADVQKAAADIFRDNHLNVAVITPSKDEKAISSLLSF